MPHPEHKAFHYLPVRKRKNPLLFFNQRHLHPEAGEYARVLAPYDPAAYYSEGRGNAFKLKYGIAVVDMLRIKRYVGGPCRPASGGKDDYPGGKEVFLSAGFLYKEGVRVVKRGLAVDYLNIIP